MMMMMMMMMVMMMNSDAIQEVLIVTQCIKSSNLTKMKKIQFVSILNKLASLGATLVRNSAHLITDLITDRGKV